MTEEFSVTYSMKVKVANIDQVAGAAFEQLKAMRPAEAVFSVIGQDIRRTVTLSPTVQIGLLTEREQQVAALIMQGAANADIARELAITTRTVKAHIAHIFEKFGVGSRVALATALIRLEVENEVAA